MIVSFFGYFCSFIDSFLLCFEVKLLEASNLELLYVLSLKLLP